MPPTDRGVHAASTSAVPATAKRPEVRVPEGIVHAKSLATAPFELREDGSIAPAPHPMGERQEGFHVLRAFVKPADGLAGGLLHRQKM